MVAVAQADELALGRQPGVAPVVEAHLQRDLDRRGAVRGVEHIAERPAAQRGQALGQFHRGGVRAAGEHHVPERVQLARQRGVDARVGVAEQVDPPRAGGVEIAAAVGIEQPRAFAAHDRQRQGVVIGAQAGAGVPDGVAAALA
ncbi:hypothetical protein D3C81_1535480 [compost metagenome]